MLLLFFFFVSNAYKCSGGLNSKYISFAHQLYVKSLMENQTEKVYVAVGNDLQDGFKTLEWTLKKWSFHPISIVILHVTYNVSKDFVYTPCKIYMWKNEKWKISVFRLIKFATNKFYFFLTYFQSVGKLPATSVSDEKLEVLKKYEKETIDKLLSKYLSFCGKVWSTPILILILILIFISYCLNMGN